MNAQNVLNRFKSQISWVSQSVTHAFGNALDLEDVEQEASIRVLNYAGAVDNGWGHGKLAGWESRSRGNEKDVKALLATQLRRDLNQKFYREVRQTLAAGSLDDIDESEAAYDDFEEKVVSRLDGYNLRKAYPTLVLHFLDGYSEQEIADSKGVSVRTIKRQVVREKAALAKAHGITQDDFELAV